MDEDAINRDLDAFLETAKQLDMNLDPAAAREKIVNLHAQAEEHGVGVEDIMRRNLLRELFGGGARP